MLINGFNYKINFSKDYDINEDKNLGETGWYEKEIIVFYEQVDAIKDENYLTVLMHEIGHAHYNGLPVHMKYEKGTDAYADAFGLSLLYYDKAKKEVEKFEKRRKNEKH